LQSFLRVTAQEQHSLNILNTAQRTTRHSGQCALFGYHNAAIYARNSMVRRTNQAYPAPPGQRGGYWYRGGRNTLFFRDFRNFCIFRGPIGLKELLGWL